MLRRASDSRAPFPRARCLVAVMQTRGKTPEAVLSMLADAQATVAANLNKFRSPAGAIYHLLMNGTWPADDVLTPGEAADRARGKAVSNGKAAAERTLYAVVRAARKEKLGDGEIRERLIAAGDGVSLYECA